MKDEPFIQRMLQKGKEAGEKVRVEFQNISLGQLNWKPAPDSWSIGQCFDHLVVTDCLYFPAFKKIAANKYRMNAWQRWSPFSSLFGKILVSQLTENVKRKVNTARIFYPSASEIDMGIIDRFHKHLESLLEYIEAFKQIDLDKTYIASPVSGFITYSLRNAVTLLVHHEHRHINQAIRVKSSPEFGYIGV
ncbi:MAG TPA: DinB family protein [Chitinophagaceae bacterium]|nr:DinB family protein [Chitinophagaceae bacterium]